MTLKGWLILGPLAAIAVAWLGWMGWSVFQDTRTLEGKIVWGSIIFMIWLGWVLGRIECRLVEIREELKRARMAAEKSEERVEPAPRPEPNPEVERQLVRIGSELTALRVIAEAQAKAAGVIVPEPPEWFVVRRMGQG